MVSLDNSKSSIRISNSSTSSTLPTSEEGSISLDGNIKLRNNTTNNPTVLIDGSTNGQIVLFNSSAQPMMSLNVSGDNTYGFLRMGTTIRTDVVLYDTGSSVMTIRANDPDNSYPYTKYTNYFINFYKNNIKVFDINGYDRYIKLYNNDTTPKQIIVIDGANANINVNNSSGTNTINLDGANANIQVYNSSGTNTIKLDGFNGFIYYPQSTSQSFSLNTAIPSGTFSSTSGATYTMDLLNPLKLNPGQYYLKVDIGSGSQPTVGGINFNLTATPSATSDNYLSLMIIASSANHYNGGWVTDAFDHTNGYDNYICLSSSYFTIPKGSTTPTPTDYSVFFSISDVITITPDKPYLYIKLCTLPLNSEWKIETAQTVTYWYLPMSSTSSTNQTLIITPLS
jgi:hypothetical protein